MFTPYCSKISKIKIRHFIPFSSYNKLKMNIVYTQFHHSLIKLRGRNIFNVSVFIPLRFKCFFQRDNSLNSLSVMLIKFALYYLQKIICNLLIIWE